jgi:hypothetical protein
MNFETWTNTVGLLAHTGFGLGFLKTAKVALYSNNEKVNFIAGITQIKLSERVALTADFTTIRSAAKIPLPPHLVVSGFKEVLWRNIQWYCGYNSLLR